MIAVEHMVLAAAALGYGSCWVGAFNENRVKRILKVPENLTVVALLPVGVPDENPPAKPEKIFQGSVLQGILWNSARDVIANLFFVQFFSVP
ncbi:MAG: nitroreductase family protein [Candidatus Bathyarchaeota archaeon]|nr:nitroreductase family protein [Candidatus Bathyarchaeota archaeon]MDH5786829.1 nitroreductase family protein [Candidatus Bathyarchaeota archaeon]